MHTAKKFGAAMLTVALGSALPVSPAKATSIMIGAQIDGWSRLVITPYLVYWQHMDPNTYYPGTHNDCWCPTYFTIWNDAAVRPTIAWYPWNTNWEYWFNPILPFPNGDVSLIVVSARNAVTVFQQPTHANDYQTILDFNDGDYSDSWYTMIMAYGDCTLVTQEPIASTACLGQSHSLTAAATDASSYSWQKNGVPISLNVNPTAASSQLMLEHVKASDQGVYGCVIMGSCGPVTTRSITLKVCGGDMTCDGMVDDADFAPFATAYDLLLCEDLAMPAGCPSDFNGDGMVDDADFSIFAVAYNALLCD